MSRILIDSGSAVNVLFHQAYKQLGHRPSQLIQDHEPLLSFSGDITQPLGSDCIPLIMGTHPTCATFDTDCSRLLLLVQCNIGMPGPLAATMHHRWSHAHDKATHSSRHNNYSRQPGGSPTMLFHNRLSWARAYRGTLPITTTTSTRQARRPTRRGHTFVRTRTNSGSSSYSNLGHTSRSNGEDWISLRALGSRRTNHSSPRQHAYFCMVVRRHARHTHRYHFSQTDSLPVSHTSSSEAESFR